MTIHFKIAQSLRRDVLRHLSKPHPFAAERVGFLSCGVASTPAGLLILAEQFHPVATKDYLRDLTVGAMMGPVAIRKALQFAYSHERSMFHVHCHDHRGRPGFSGTDLRETAQFVPDFFNVRPSFPHGALILSRDSAVGLCWTQKDKAPSALSKVSFVGSELQLL